MKALKTVAPLILAGALGLVTMKYGRIMLAQRHTQAQGPTQSVLVASDDLPVGHAIVSGDFQPTDAPVELVPGQSIKDVQPAIGRVLSSPVCKGQMLTETCFSPMGTSQGLQAAVPKGKRAVTVEVNDVSGLAGMLAPGCNVDVITTFTDDDAHESVTRTVVENVPVSAVGTKMGAGSTNDDHDMYGKIPVKTVTLLVTPDEAEKLDLAYAKSKPRLVLRNATETAKASTSGVRLTQMMHMSDARPAAPQMSASAVSAPAAASTSGMEAPVPQQRTVVFIRGGVESLSYFTDASGPAPMNDVHVADKGNVH